MSCTYRIVLSIDGGGVRGIIPLKILECLNTFTKENSCTITSCAEVFASTSISTIFTGALMLNDVFGRNIYSPTDMITLYQKRGLQMFNRSTSNASPLKFLLNSFFNDFTMNDLKKHFFFASHNLTTDKPFFFNDSMDYYRELSLSDVMQACSAQEHVFPSYKLGNMELADGSRIAKNPAEYAYQYARLLYPTDPIVLISIGVGEVPLHKQDSFEKQSVLADISMQEYAKTDRKLVYFRLQPSIDFAPSEVFENIHSSIDGLIDVSNQYIDENKTKLNEINDFLKSKMA